MNCRKEQQQSKVYSYGNSSTAVVVDAVVVTIAVDASSSTTSVISVRGHGARLTNVHVGTRRRSNPIQNPISLVKENLIAKKNRKIGKSSHQNHQNSKESPHRSQHVRDFFSIFDFFFAQEKKDETQEKEAQAGPF